MVCVNLKVKVCDIFLVFFEWLIDEVKLDWVLLYFVVLFNDKLEIVVIFVIRMIM